MTPKQKANELVNQYVKLTDNWVYGIKNWEHKKQCASISVDDTIKALNILLKSGLNNDFDILALRGDYMEIRKEIELL